MQCESIIECHKFMYLRADGSVQSVKVGSIRLKSRVAATEHYTSALGSPLFIQSLCEQTALVRAEGRELKHGWERVASAVWRRVLVSGWRDLRHNHNLFMSA